VRKTCKSPALRVAAKRYWQYELFTPSKNVAPFEILIVQKFFK
jgi:hypothetical protein